MVSNRLCFVGHLGISINIKGQCFRKSLKSVVLKFDFEYRNRLCYTNQKFKYDHI